MIYEIKWKPKPMRFLDKIPTELATRIWNKIGKLKENPFRYLEHHEGDSFFKLRIGDYRALITVDVELKVLIVEVLDKRSRIYKR